jgi:hypothetical protein
MATEVGMTVLSMADIFTGAELAGTTQYWRLTEPSSR